MRLEWPTSAGEQGSFETSSLDALVNDDAGTSQLAHQSTIHAMEERYHAQLVLHYPQFIFAATDGDVHSRALVLRGLAIVKGLKASGRSHSSNESMKINADYQNVSSHIMPDASEILCIAGRHYDRLTECLPEYVGVYRQDTRLSTSDKVDELGVALLLCCCTMQLMMFSRQLPI